MNQNLLSIIIIVVTGIISYTGFTKSGFREKYIFDAQRIIQGKEYIRLISSGFLHADWMHLAFNMMSLFFFGGGILQKYGVFGFLLIYFTSLLGGNLYSLFIHRHKRNYRALGASGAVSGMIFAFVAADPTAMFLVFFIIPMPAWLFAILFVAYSIYGMRAQKDNIGHDAHLSGAITGLIAAILLRFSLLQENYIAIIGLLVPTIGFMAFSILRPQILIREKMFSSSSKGLKTMDDAYNEKRRIQQLEIDRILDKINDRGINALSAEERRKLEEYSNK